MSLKGKLPNQQTKFGSVQKSLKKAGKTATFFGAIGIFLSAGASLGLSSALLHSDVLTSRPVKITAIQSFKSFSLGFAHSSEQHQIYAALPTGTESLEDKINSFTAQSRPQRVVLRKKFKQKKELVSPIVAHQVEAVSEADRFELLHRSLIKKFEIAMGIRQEEPVQALAQTNMMNLRMNTQTKRVFTPKKVVSSSKGFKRRSSPNRNVAVRADLPRGKVVYPFSAGPQEEPHLNLLNLAASAKNTLSAKMDIQAASPVALQNSPLLSTLHSYSEAVNDTGIKIETLSMQKLQEVTEEGSAAESLSGEKTDIVNGLSPAVSGEQKTDMVTSTQAKSEGTTVATEMSIQKNEDGQGAAGRNEYSVSNQQSFEHSRQAAFEFADDLEITTATRVSWTRDQNKKGLDLIEAPEHTATLADSSTKDVPLISRNSILLLAAQGQTKQAAERAIVFGRVPQGLSVRLSGKADAPLYIDAQSKQFVDATNTRSERHFVILNASPGAVKLTLMAGAFDKTSWAEAGNLIVPTLAGVSTYVDFGRANQRPIVGVVRKAYDEGVDGKRGSAVANARVTVAGDHKLSAMTDEKGVFRIESVLTVGELPVTFDIEREDLATRKTYQQRFDWVSPGSLNKKVDFFALSKNALDQWKKLFEGGIEPKHATLVAPMGGIYSQLGLKQPLYPRLTRVASTEAGFGQTKDSFELYTVAEEGTLEAGLPVTKENSLVLGVELKAGLYRFELTDTNGHTVWSRVFSTDSRLVSVQY